MSENELQVDFEPSEPDLPKLYFKVSNDERDLPRQNQLTEYLNNFVPAWKEVGTRVLLAFEKVTKKKWNPEDVKGGLSVTLSAIQIPHAYPEIVLRHRDYSIWAEENGKYKELLSHETQFSDLTHELAHRFEADGDREYVIAKYGHFINDDNLRDDRRSIEKSRMTVGWHIHTLVLWEAVMREVFPSEIVEQNIARERRLGPVFMETYRILDQLSPDEKQQILLQKHKTRTFKQEGITRKF